VVRRSIVKGQAESTPQANAAELCVLHETRARAELLAADALAPGSDAVAWRGAILAEVAVVKGLPGPAEVSGGAALSGADGDAATKALGALGYAEDVVYFTLSRPGSGIDPERMAARLRAQIEAVDPLLILAVDDEAASDVAAAFGIEKPAYGRAERVLGRRFVAVGGLEASLTDPARKRRVWEQLKAARPEGPVY
jgi:uracil-DNA glycosylase